MDTLAFVANDSRGHTSGGRLPECRGKVLRDLILINMSQARSPLPSIVLWIGAKMSAAAKWASTVRKNRRPPAPSPRAQQPKGGRVPDSRAETYNYSKPGPSSRLATTNLTLCIVNGLPSFKLAAAIPSLPPSFALDVDAPIPHDLHEVHVSKQINRSADCTASCSCPSPDNSQGALKLTAGR